MLLLQQEPYLPYTNLNYTNLDYKIFTTILKIICKKTLDTIIGENQSVANKNRTILHKFSTIRAVIDVSYKSNLALIFFEIFWTFYKVDWVSCYS